MKIKLAKNISFCLGVRIAEKKILELRDKITDDIYIFGELIHNKIFNNYLKEKRIFISENLEDIRNKTVVIRTHGIAPEIEKNIKENAREVLNLTCSKVKAVHKIVEEYSKKGYFIIITGDPDHPEVKGIRGYADNCVVIASVEEAMTLNINPKDCILVVSQTTFNLNTFTDIIDIIKRKTDNLVVKNTICDATSNRQKEAREIAENSDFVIIIGDKKSSNTKKLYEIVKNINNNVFYIEKADELKSNFFDNINDNSVIGIVSGASTPMFVINKVIEKIKNGGKDE
ncbi:MAG TPA: 4-hydroxy-3-methylbut-2-enyl diphosphate reductase [Spirochaetota bacterium]|nr:4-hydroxy-3-methylbut-2-enyl diphosphate reductase [Spirochaetota bacterium]HOM38333.1 4-hydroxy-3-methylbut-2-enyl diphosphate reductase [Spirochaetota bacterium]HPQ48449.1 4-hydroxy-3-methylbut-2-enyl diphosphate reductase [Spirochaetota bacterium]